VGLRFIFEVLFLFQIIRKLSLCANEFKLTM